MRARAVGDVVVNAHGEGIRLLEHHAHAAPQLVYIRAGRVDILILVLYLARYLNAGHEVVHAVERFQKRRFAAAGGPDERRYALFGDLHIYIFKRLRLPVPQAQVVYAYDAAHMLLLLS